MIEQAVEIPTADGSAEGLLYHSEDKDKRPGVLYLSDILGIREANRGMARRVAELGYTVLMPNLFYRAGRIPVFDFKPNFGDEPTTKRIRELSAPLTPDAVERDASAYVDFLSKNNAVSPGPMGVVGFCASGSMAMRAAAARSDRIAAAASFHAGRLYTDQPTSPHLLLPHIKARLYFGHAVHDKGMPAESIEKFEGALQSWGGQYQSETYPNSLHGWTVPDSPIYNPAQAERALEKLKELFVESLQKPS